MCFIFTAPNRKLSSVVTGNSLFLYTLKLSYVHKINYLLNFNHFYIWNTLKEFRLLVILKDSSENFPYKRNQSMS
jgi:hypothetical protein